MGSQRMKRLDYFILLLFFSFVVYTRAETEFKEGLCSSGQLQSPIMLPRAGATKKMMGDIVFHHYHQAMKGIRIANSGRTLEMITEEWNSEATPYIRGADLPGKFILDKIIVHWGEGLNEGSEHIV